MKNKNATSFDESHKTTDEFYKKLFKLVLPIAFQQFMLALVSASDAFMLGLKSQTSLSAVSLATQITFVQNLFLAAMTIGLSMFAAQYWGKNDKAAVEKVFAYVMKITAIVSFGFFLAALCMPKLLMRIFTQEELLIEGGAVYLVTVSPAYFLTGVAQIYLCILKNTDKALITSLISSTSVVVNIVLNALFIFGLLGLPELGIAGAALATVLAKVVEVVWCIAETAKKGSAKLVFNDIVRVDKPLRRDFWKYTTPVLCNEIVWGLGFTMYSVIMGHLGTDAVAANSIANIVKNLVACFALGVASGGGIIVGNELGAGNLDKARLYGRRVIVFALVSGAFAGCVVLAASPLIVTFANLTETATGYLQVMLAVCALNLVGYAINTSTVAGIFCAGGDTKFGLKCDGIVMWGIVVPSGAIAAFLLKLPVPIVFLVLNLDEIVKLPAVIGHYKKYKWVKNLTRQQTEEVTENV